MTITPSEVHELIRSRRAIFPNTYTDQPIGREIIMEILENANWAPSHKLTEPWRFKVMMGNSLQKLSEYMGDYYKEHTPAASFSDLKYKKNMENPLRSACVIAICMKRDEEGSVPEWEEIAAVACSVQNMWLTCTSYGIGCYWSTPSAALDAGDFLGLEAGERCLGFFYMGYHKMPAMPGKRNPIEQKITWILE